MEDRDQCFPENSGLRPCLPALLSGIMADRHLLDAVMTKFSGLNKYFAVDNGAVGHKIELLDNVFF